MRARSRPTASAPSRVVRRGLLAGMLAAVVALGAPASAQDADTSVPREQVVLSGRLVVAEGETVDTAVIFNGPAAIDGRVDESVVVFNGDTVITGTVGGDVVVFNGTVLVRSGATIGGNLVTVSDPNVEPGATIRGEQRRVGEIDAPALGFASRFAWWIGYSVSTLLLGIALLGLAPGLDAALAGAARARTGASIGFGAAAFFLLPVVAVLLIAIVLAIPLGLFLLLALALVYTVGYVAGAHVLGRRLIRPPKSRFGAFLAGWGILRAIALIPVLGGLAWIVASIFGLGVLWVAARVSRAMPTPDRPAMPPMPQPAR